MPGRSSSRNKRIGKGGVDSGNASPVSTNTPRISERDWKDDVIAYYRNECITAWVSLPIDKVYGYNLYIGNHYVLDPTGKSWLQLHYLMYNNRPFYIFKVSCILKFRNQSPEQSTVLRFCILTSFALYTPTAPIYSLSRISYSSLLAEMLPGCVS